jgi:hypothetical protein
MNFDAIESPLCQSLKKQLGADFHFSIGPQTAPACAGIQTEVNVHATECLDFAGVTTDGATVARYGIREAGTTGYQEERPGLIVVCVACIAANYRIVQRCCGQIAPAALSCLGALGELSLGLSPDGGSEIRFLHGKACLHRAATSMESDGKGSYCRGEMQFHLDGFLQVTARWKAKRRKR